MTPTLSHTGDAVEEGRLTISNLSHYRIVSKIGAGGMGEVWLAKDTRLKRKVALKLLPAELTADADRAIEQCRKVLELNPNYLIARSFLAEVYEQQGDFVSAVANREPT